ncbi:MAG: glycosyltransferase family 1 protein [Planctomycetaceae bacterium]|nr:glycosyltransferase family 1 protein [Planctomycetaceae bacterium]
MRHQVTRALAKHYRVLYVYWPYEWRRKHRSRFAQVEPNIAVWQAGNLLTPPERLAAIAPLLNMPERIFLKRQIRRFLRKTKIFPVGVVNFDYRHHWIQDNALFPRSIYICNDDFPGLARRAGKVFLAEHKARQMRDSARSADACLATSEHIATLLGARHKTTLFPPGHDLIVPQSYRTTHERTSQRLKVGYMGSIDTRINVQWIQHSAMQSDIEWHMIGPVSPDLLGALASSNIHFHKPVTGPALLNWMQGMDVLTIPFDLSADLSPAFAVPNKTYFYLAAGKPIVVPDLPGFCELGEGIVYRAESAEGFVLKIRQACSEDNETRVQQRLRIASENTWEVRIKELCRLLEP